MAGQMWDLAATPIGQAITEGDVNKMNELIKQKENVHFKDRKKNTYLHYVCTMYRPSIFYALVAAGVDVSAQNRHGNTALHVTALKREACHVGDLMTCGVDPAIRNKDGKTAAELGTQNKYWHMIYEKYKPGIFQAVEDHDLPRIKELIQCWCRVDCMRNKVSLRQYAALLTFHDIVVLIDENKPTIDMIFGVFEGNHEKVREALKKTKCKVNFLNKIAARKHILQYAIKFRDFEFVKMLCDAGADVNMLVRVNNYFWGPLYFEAIHKDVPLNIIFYILKSGADFTLKDERGRTAFMYALDRENGVLPMEIFQYMIKNGADITQRDSTGCDSRDIARFARRQDVVDLIDKTYIKIIRNSDMDTLTDMAVNGYGSLIITHNYRDTWIYAAGNKTDDALRFVEELPQFQESVERVHGAILSGSTRSMKAVLDQSSTPELIINARNKARRTPLIQAVIHAREDIVVFILGLQYDVNLNAQDVCNCTAYHFACCLPEDVGEVIRTALVNAGIDTSIKDVKGRTGEDFARRPDRLTFIEKEQKAVYGMDLELMCVDRYEEMRRLIRAKKKGLKEFEEFIRNFKFPVVALHKILSPLMPSYRDLIFLAIDYNKQDIAYKLANLGADLGRREKYERLNKEDDTKETNFYTPAERAAHLGMAELAKFLSTKRQLQVKKLKKHQTLLPKRVIQRYFPVKINHGASSSVFVTQHDFGRSKSFYV